ncbi:SpoIIE family protein phosphatase [Aneurinibacillus sp. BA2021]|nr:SpoIIE family protein phosphatase [Aneurinibacillus sp. BA2021]
MHTNESVPYSFHYSVHHTSKKPNTPSGDCYYVGSDRQKAMLSIADGLGSGPEAKASAEKMIQEIETYTPGEMSPLSLLEEGNRTLHGSRGSVVGIAMIDIDKKQLSYAGIGNITCLVVTPARQKHYLISNPGFLNGRPFRGVERYVPYHPEDTVLIFSDGIQLPDNWEYIVTDKLPPDIILQRLVHEMKPVNDDATLIVGKWLQEKRV